ncbi:MAG: hypothetical protein IMF10_05315 [Proteobacteria bacterium]|nr:hypothetical protein [Pseudomonadota bacterium]
MAWIRLRRICPWTDTSKGREIVGADALIGPCWCLKGEIRGIPRKWGNSVCTSGYTFYGNAGETEVKHHCHNAQNMEHKTHVVHFFVKRRLQELPQFFEKACNISPKSDGSDNHTYFEKYHKLWLIY